MEIGEVLALAQEEIYESAVKTFQERGIPPTLARIVMSAVRDRFNESAIAQTTKNLSQLSIQHETLKAMVNKKDTEDEENGDTTQEGRIH